MNGRGTIIVLKLDKGYGFIKDRDSKHIFFHMTGMTQELDWGERLMQLPVEFETESDMSGRVRAINVRPVRNGMAN